MGQELVLTCNIAQPGIVIGEAWLHSHILSRIQALRIISLSEALDFILREPGLSEIEQRCLPVQAEVQPELLDWHAHAGEDNSIGELIKDGVLRISPMQLHVISKLNLMQLILLQVKDKDCWTLFGTKCFTKAFSVQEFVILPIISFRFGLLSFLTGTIGFAELLWLLCIFEERLILDFSSFSNENDLLRVAAP